MTDGNFQLDEWFRRYRAACPEVDPAPNFMPGLWNKIESRRTFAFTFERLAKPLMTVLGAICALLLVLNLAGIGQTPPTAASYADALAADSSAERTYYTEAIRDNPTGFQAPAELRHARSR
jgi:hypothetical protein